MSKHNISLTLVEMYAIKHGLQRTLVDKKVEFETMQHLTISEGNIKRYEKLKKDIPHEEELITRFESEIRYESIRKEIFYRCRFKINGRWRRGKISFQTGRVLVRGEEVRRCNVC